MAGALTFSLQELELLSGSQEVFPKNGEDDGQGDGGDEDVRPHDGHGEDGPRNNQCQLERSKDVNNTVACFCSRIPKTLNIKIKTLNWLMVQI